MSPANHKWTAGWPTPTADEQAGIDWWNGLSRDERGRRLKAVHTPSASECWKVEKAQRAHRARPPLGVVQHGDRFVSLFLRPDGWTLLRGLFGPFGVEHLDHEPEAVRQYAAREKAPGWAVLRISDGALVAGDYPVTSPPPVKVGGVS